LLPHHVPLGRIRRQHTPQKAPQPNQKPPPPNTNTPPPKNKQVEHRNRACLQRLRALIAAPSKRFYVFANEFCRATYVDARPGEGPNDRNDRAIRVAAKWCALAVCALT
jgi:hypothetical protein